jgi:hypothetical protein
MGNKFGMRVEYRGMEWPKILMSFDLRQGRPFLTAAPIAR